MRKKREYAYKDNVRASHASSVILTGISSPTYSLIIRSGNISLPVSAFLPDCPAPRYVKSYPRKSEVW